MRVRWFVPIGMATFLLALSAACAAPASSPAAPASPKSGAAAPASGAAAPASGAAASPAGAAAAPAGGAAASPASQAAKAAGQPLKIAQLVSLTGYLVSYDAALRTGQELAAAEINAQGGVNGRPITFVTEDVRSDPSPAVTALNKLLGGDKPDLLTGGSCSACTRAMAPIVAQAQMPIIVLSVLPPAEEAVGRPWIYTVIAEPILDLQVNFAWLKAQGANKKVAILHDASPYSVMYKDLAAAEAPKQGVEVVAIESYQANATDLSPQLTRVKALNADAILKVGAGPTDGIAPKNMRALGMSMPLVLRADTLPDEVAKVAGDSTDLVYFAAPLLLLTDSLPDSDPRKARILKFREQLQAKGSDINVIFAARGYDIIMLYADAIKRAGSLDPIKVRDALDATKDFVGIAASYQITPEKHSAASDPFYRMSRLQGAKVVPLP